MLNNKDNFGKKYDKYRNIIRVVEFIKENYAKNHTIEYYADLCNLDKYYFIKLFREYTSVSPHLFRTKIRIEKAKELLANTDMKNSQIAELTGYSSPYYFSRIFKIHTGVSPEAFRTKKQ